MARYSRRNGPFGPFELTAAFQDIPQASITRHFDNGELLILYYATFLNGTAGPITIRTRVVLDGTPLTRDNPRINLAAAQEGATAAHHLLTLWEGIHTIAIQAQGVAAAGDVANNLGTQLIVIQHPLWDSDPDIT